jgi:hypothetical protein
MTKVIAEACGEICRTDPCQRCKAVQLIGVMLARRVFKIRKGNVEIHISEAELAAMLSAAAEHGWNQGREHE